jgi:alpha-2-macroglobulin
MSSQTISESSPIPVRPWRTLLAAVAAVVVGAVAVAVMLSIPPDGRVTGRCYDRSTRQPLVNVVIQLTYDGSDNSSDSDDESPDEHDSNIYGSDTAPEGWSQGSDADDADSLTGNSTDPRDTWQALTDSQGRFVFPRVPVGSYKISYPDSPSDDDALDVVVADGSDATVDLAVTPASPMLNFESPSINWLPGEVPQLILDGAGKVSKVVLRLDRIDPKWAVQATPITLVQPLNGDFSAAASSILNNKIADEGYKFLSEWTMPVAHHPNDDDFVERVKVADPSGNPLAPGFYRLGAALTDGVTCATAWIRVTRLAVVVKQHQSRILVQTIDLETGKTDPHASVALFDSESDKELSSANVSAQGLANLSSASASEETSGVLIARDGDSITGVTLDMNSPGSEGDDSDSSSAPDLTGKPPLRAFIYTDRPVYRPGQTVYVKGIMRRFAAPDGFETPANRPVSVQVRDADETVVYHASLITDALGTWNASFALSSETLTGEYTITANLEGQTEDDTFLVAAYHKPEYEAKIAFDKNRYVRGDTMHVTVSASYYYGAPVIGAKADVDVYAGASPDDGDGGGQSQGSGMRDNVNVDGDPILDKTAILGADGTAEIDVPTSGASDDDSESAIDGASTSETYSVSVSVDDGSGTTADTTGETVVAPGEFDLSVQAASSSCSDGVPDEVTVTATNPDGSPVVGRAVALKSYFDDWVNGVETRTPVSSSTLDTDNLGSAITTIVPTHDGLVVVQGSTTDSRGDTITAEDEIWITGGAGDLNAHYAGLSLVLDRKIYHPGDTAHLLINTVHPGPDALVDVEGADLYQTMVIPLEHHTTEVSIPVTLTYAPSVTISAQCIFNKQPLSSQTTLTIDDPRRPLTVAIAADRKTYKPGETATLSIMTRDAVGKPVPAEISVGVVDSAVYAIAPEDTRDIVEAMEPEQGDVVETSTSCDSIYYGDVDKGSTVVDIRRKFPDTALWQPDLRTGVDGKAQVSFTMPDNLTTWHATCIGVTAATQVGRATADMLVTKDLVVRLEMPNFLVAGDQSQITEIANNNTKSPMQVGLNLTAPQLGVPMRSSVIPVTAVGGAPASKVWSVSSARPGTVTVTATADGTSGDYGPSDGIALPLSVEPHGVTNSTWTSGALDLQALGSGSASIPVTIPSNAILDASSVRVRVFPTIGSAIMPAVQYLAVYPCGGADTVSDALVGDAVASQATGANGSPQAIPLQADEAATLKAMTERSVLRLEHLRNDDGGWGWFSVDRTNLYMTTDGLWALNIAQSAGYRVDADVLSSGSDQLARMDTAIYVNHSRRYAGVDFSTLTQTALLLARLHRIAEAKTSLAYIQRYKTAYPLSFDMTERARIALAEQAVGGVDAAKAQADMAQLWLLAREAGGTYSWTIAYHRGQQGVTEDWPDPDATAWVLLAAEAITPDDPRIPGAARWLMMNRNDDHWSSSTSTTATCIMALTAYLQRSRELSPNFSATVAVNGRTAGAYTFSSKSVDDVAPLLELPAASIGGGQATISVSAKGSGQCYYSVENRVCMPVGAPQEFSLLRFLVERIAHPAGLPPLPPTASGYRIKRVYLRTTSRRNFLMEDTVPKPDASFNVGEDIVVRLIIDCMRPGSRIVVNEPAPAGCSITDLEGDAVDDWSNWWDYTDVRDDRLVFYISDLPRGRHEIDYHLHAQTPGRYDAMPTMITSVLDPTLNATGVASRIRIDGR